VLIWINFSIGSPVLGLAAAPIYLLINTTFISQVFFPGQSNALKRIFYGFLVLFSFIVVLGSITYWFFIDFSNTSFLAILIILTVSLSMLNKLAGGRMQRSQNHANPQQQQIKRGITSGFGPEDFLIITSLIICFYLLSRVRTGESIVILDTIPTEFYISYFSACMFTLMKAFRGKSRSAIFAIYLFLLLFVPSSIYLIVLQYPYATNMMALNLEHARWLDVFGRFVSDPEQPEAFASLMGRVVTLTGWPVGMVAIARFFQLDTQIVGLLFTPIIFPFTVILATFDLMRIIVPKNRKLAIFCSASFLASQHNIFLFTPPGKPETLALGMLLVNILFWVKYTHRCTSWNYLVASIVMLLSILLIHPYVGLFAIFIAATSLSLFHMRPFSGSKMRLGIGLVSLMVLLLAAVSVFLPLHSLLHTLSGGLQVAETKFWNLDASKSLEALLPALWTKSDLKSFDYFIYHFINNSSYSTYALIVLGLVAAFKYKLSKHWLMLSCMSILLAISYRVLTANFLSVERYRFFYYLSFLSFPLIGVGLYWLFTRVGRSLILDFKSGMRRVSLRAIQISALLLVSSLIFTSSIYAGLPREDSMGPYSWKGLAFPSDYDVSALEFIKRIEGGGGHYYVVGDAFTTSAGAMVLGYWTIPTPDGYVPNLSFWSKRELWLWAVFDQSKYLTEGIEYTNRLANRTYLILTYRIAYHDLNALFERYSLCFGDPIYVIQDKVYVFTY